jgi:hypothetical protein
MRSLSHFAVAVPLLAAIILLSPSKTIAATAYPGYTFCASGATAYLLDMNGKTLHTWTASGSAQTCAYLLADGSALFPIQNTSCSSPQHNGAYPSGRFQKISWTNVVTWDYSFCDSTARAGYDVEPMPNGNILFPADSTSGVSKLFEIQPSGTSGGTIVWSNTLPSSLSGSTTYLNSAKYNPALDAIVVDLQDPQRDLVVISHSTGAVLFTNLVGSSGRVHAANWVSKYFMGTTNLMPDCDYAAMRTNNLLVVYNGGTNAVEVSMATSNKVKTFSVAYNDHEGSVQRLPNGNTLVSIGNTTSIIELDTNGNTVATITAPGNIDRAYRYGYAFPGVARLVTNVLTIVSPHGTFTPKATTTNAYGALVSAYAALAETNAGVALYTNAGWTLSGVRATNNTASGTGTNLVLRMTNNATLTWAWKTNFWLAAVTNGSGSLAFANGGPGWNPFASNVTLTATAGNNSSFSAWSGDTNGCTLSGTQLIAPMTQARAITATFATSSGCTLTVVSAHGSPNPSGTTTNTSGTLISALVNNVETYAGSVQYTNNGWNLTGGADTTGAAGGTGTNVNFYLTNNTTLVWQWKTNYWLAAASNGYGSVNVTAGALGWNGATANVTLAASASTNWHFSAWSGDTNSCSFSSAQLVAPMNQARAVTGIFAIDSSALAAVCLNITLGGNGSALIVGTTNLPTGASAALLYSTSLVGSVWQTGAIFTAASAATNWSLPASNVAGFYRMQLN